jgi:hypothetical protein
MMSRATITPELDFLRHGEYSIVLGWVEKRSAGECNYATKTIKINLINSLGSRVIRHYIETHYPDLPIKEFSQLSAKRRRHMPIIEFWRLAIRILGGDIDDNSKLSPERKWFESSVRKVSFGRINNQKKWSIFHRHDGHLIIDLSRIIVETFVHEMAHAINAEKNERATIRVEQKRLRQLSASQTAHLARVIIEHSIVDRHHRFIKSLLLNKGGHFSTHCYKTAGSI